MILCPSILQHQKLHGKYYWWNCVLIHAEKVSRPFSPRSACLEPFGGPDAKLKLDPVGLSLMRTGQQQESTGWEYSQFSSTKNQNKVEHLPPALSFPFCNTPWPPRYQAKAPATLLDPGLVLLWQTQLQGILCPARQSSFYSLPEGRWKSCRETMSVLETKAPEFQSWLPFHQLWGF